jgi:hypothetical protein
MATVRTCDRCGVSSPVEMNQASAVRAYAFDTYSPHHPNDALGGCTTVADLCEECAVLIRRQMTTPLARPA